MASFRGLLTLFCGVLFVLLPFSGSWRSYIPWDLRPWCAQVASPQWPFAYRKSPSQIFELKGRTVSNTQDFRHVCTTRGAQSICHRCEEFICGTGIDARPCNMQLQGILWAQLPSNIPTVTDTPFALGVNVTHRNDFGNAEKVCVFVQGGACLQHNTTDFSSCAVRCWGKTYDPPVPYQFGWTYPKDQGLPQGKVFTLAGSGSQGFADGVGNAAKFDRPEAVAVDIDRNVYVADTGNHCIRRISPDGTVTTFAGLCTVAGFRDGPLDAARFRSPSGITLYHNASDHNRLTMYVSDTGNHRIRRIRKEPGWDGNWEVVTWAGGRSVQLDSKISPAGLQNGMRTEAAFNYPRGLAVDDTNALYVADTFNHVIRYVDPTGNVSILAGMYVSMWNASRGREGADPGCIFPCWEGVPGFDDGPRQLARFSFPQDVSIGENHTIYVVGDNRLRRITRAQDNSSVSAIQGILSYNRVETVAGALEGGRVDGNGPVARFEDPKGVMMSPNGRIFVADALQCRIRRVSPSYVIARNITCSTRLVDLIRPSGCTLYDPPVDVFDRLQTPLANHIVYNENLTSSFHIQTCMGTPPPSIGPTSSGVVSSSAFGGGGSSAGGGATGFTTFDVNEQTDYGTTFRLYCPPGCFHAAVVSTETFLPTGVFGTDYYADVSRLCASAGHAGYLTNDGGMFEVRVEAGWGPFAHNGTVGAGRALNGTKQNFIQSQTLGGWDRTFTVHAYPLNTDEVYTLAGVPTAPLHDACGYKDGQPPQETQFRGPSGLAMYYHANLTDTDYLYIADTANNVIRAMTAVCSQMCENGGRCVADEKCLCPSGWAGLDCTTPVCTTPCGTNQFCSGNNTCSCKPGYSGPGCVTPLCVQTCIHGTCRAPDTCTCDVGWFDANCTTPVCDVTCGNGGNCTNPSGTVKCTCPAEWTGDTCREPVCSKVQCLNGGKCVAPDTCWCPPEWSGHDCSKPVCMQGYFRADPVPQHFSPPSYADVALRPLSWPQYVPCSYQEWCNSTEEFDCAQIQRTVPAASTVLDRTVTGFHAWQNPSAGSCFRLELQSNIIHNYRLDMGDGGFTIYKRNDSNFLFPAQSIVGSQTAPWSAPNPAPQDRQVAYVQFLNVTQGVYVCANGGNCTAPGLCHCAPGWVGFDCRTPICAQGWYEPLLPPTDPVSKQLEVWALDQGSYNCSQRSLTIWENPYRSADTFLGYIHNHPNYYTRYADLSRGWPAVHHKLPPLGDETNEGWRRNGWWQTTGEMFRKGTCNLFFKRTCPGDPSKEISLVTGTNLHPVNDLELAYAPRVIYTSSRVIAAGRWKEQGGECIDHVLDGCFNNGTCVSPDTCQCSSGWEGHDCSLPICSQTTKTIYEAPGVHGTLLRANGVNVGNPTSALPPPPLPGDTFPQYRKCPNNGNCTLPNTCTCEKGWTGPDCTIPLCAQECFHGGVCVAPDTCKCKHWWNSVKDARGRPVFRKSNGDPQDTGYTGYDCNVPICVQAKQFLLNDGGNYVLVASATNSSTYQGGCANATRYTPGSRTRVSSYLCNVEKWWEGIYVDSWANGLASPPYSKTSRGRYIRSNFDNYIQINSEKWIAGPLVEGEGIFACFNNGSCVAPDTCECPDGWNGVDCSVPLCRHVNVFNETVSCLHRGICGSRDKCTCVQRPSLLHLMHPDEPKVLTGYNGSDCSIAMCTQGWFDPTCKDVPGGRQSVSSGGQGCFRCANGGNCTSPDFCTCPPEWTGYDCRTPVCTQQSTPQIITDLATVDAVKISQFELDPCGTEFRTEWRGMMVGRGNCTAPNLCTCFCDSRSWRNKGGNLVKKPWKDQLSVLTIPVGYRYGSYDCISGWEGMPDEANPNRFRTCHLRIFVPSWIRRNMLALAGGVIGGLIVGVICWMIVRRRLRQKYLLAKAERRRSRRSSEEERLASH